MALTKGRLYNGADVPNGPDILAAINSDNAVDLKKRIKMIGILVNIILMGNKFQKII